MSLKVVLHQHTAHEQNCSKELPMQTSNALSSLCVGLLCPAVPPSSDSYFTTLLIFKWNLFKPHLLDRESRSLANESSFIWFPFHLKLLLFPPTEAVWAIESMLSFMAAYISALYLPTPQTLLFHLPERHRSKGENIFRERQAKSTWRWGERDSETFRHKRRNDRWMVEDGIHW